MATNPHKSHPIVRDGSGNAGTGWIVAVLLAAAVVLGIWYMMANRTPMITGESPAADSNATTQQTAPANPPAAATPDPSTTKTDPAAPAQPAAPAAGTSTTNP